MNWMTARAFWLRLNMRQCRSNCLRRTTDRRGPLPPVCRELEKPDLGKLERHQESDENDSNPLRFAYPSREVSRCGGTRGQSCGQARAKREFKGRPVASQRKSSRSDSSADHPGVPPVQWRQALFPVVTGPGGPTAFAFMAGKTIPAVAIVRKIVHVLQATASATARHRRTAGLTSLYRFWPRPWRGWRTRHTTPT